MDLSRLASLSSTLFCTAPTTSSTFHSFLNCRSEPLRFPVSPPPYLQPAAPCTISHCPQIPGVVGFYSAKDVPGSNSIGPVWLDEEVFATSVVTAVGQVRVWDNTALSLSRALPRNVRWALVSHMTVSAT